MGTHFSCLRSCPDEHNSKRKRSKNNQTENTLDIDNSPSDSPPFDTITHSDTITPRNDTYHRVNTSSSSLLPSDIYDLYLHQDLEECSLLHSVLDVQQIEVHRRITIGYIMRETAASISLPQSIIELCRKYYYAPTPIRRKRVVFTSIVQLNRNIVDIPSFILNESIFFFKMSRDELLEAMSDDEDTVTSQSSYHSSYIKDLHPLFKMYLRKKSEENLLLVLHGNKGWNHISMELSAIDDLWNTHRRYNGLLLDTEHWIQRDKYGYKYDVDCMDIIEELNDASLKYAPSMEILWRSNPTLIPMNNFDVDAYEAENGYINAVKEVENEMKSRIPQLPSELPNTRLGETYTGSNADLVVLSMYNSGNDFSVISDASYCDELSYSGINGINASFAYSDIYNNVAITGFGYNCAMTQYADNYKNSACNLCQTNYAKYTYD